MAEQLLDTVQAADYLGLKPGTLETWRWDARRGPAFIRLSKRAVRYRRSDLDAWLDAQTVNAGGAA